MELRILRGFLFWWCDHNPGGPIRIFGVGLLAVAAIAAAGFWFTRRREEFVIERPAYRRGELDGLRAAGL